MKITNRFSFPKPIVDAVINDPYNAGDCDISCTKLIGPPRIRVLTKRHWDQMEEDVSDRIYALMGKIGHLILEQAGDQSIVEKRFFMDRYGWRISGQVDLIMTGEHEADMWDYKFTSIWTAKEGAKNEWVTQQNVLKVLCEENGINIRSLNICCVYRDFSARKVLRERDYPPRQVEAFHLPIWSREAAEEYIRLRVKIHQDAERELPECSDYERWASPRKFAVMKPGRKKAVKLFLSHDEAHELAVTDPKHYIQERPGENIRCESYCACAKFCTQYQAIKSLNVNPQPDYEPGEQEY